MTSRDVVRRAGSGLAGVSAIYLASRILPAVLSLLSIKIFYAELGPVEFGRYVILNSLVLMGANVGSTWLAQSVLRYRSQYTSEPEQAVHEKALQVGAVGSALIGCAIAAVFLAIRGASVLATVAVGAALSSLLWYSVLAVAAQADMKPLRFLVAESMRSGGAFAVAVGLMSAGFTNAYIPVAALCIGNIAGILVYRWRSVPSGVIASGAARTELVRYARYGVPMIVWMLVSVLINTADRFIVEGLLGEEQLGVYAAITDLSYKTAIVILMPLGIAFHPVVMKAWNDGDAAAAYRSVRQAIAATFVAGSVLLVGFAAGAPALQRFATGAVVGDGTAMVVLGAAAAILWQLGVVIQKPLEMHDRTRVLSALAAVGWLAQVAVLVAFLPRVGVVAASAGLALASAVYVVLVATASMRLAPRQATGEGVAFHSRSDT